MCTTWLSTSGKIYVWSHSLEEPLHGVQAFAFNSSMHAMQRALIAYWSSLGL